MSEQTIPPAEPIVIIDNLHELLDFFSKIKFKSKYGDTIMFTNGNEWYIDTLINNLIVSYNKWNKVQDRVIGVICTDNKAYEKAKNLGFACINLYSKDLEVNEYYDTSKQLSYNRLCFVKTIVTYYALLAGYTILYIDPDMSFNLNRIKNEDDKVDDYIIELLEGKKSGYIFKEPNNPYSPVIGFNDNNEDYDMCFVGTYAFANGMELCHIHLSSNIMFVKNTDYTKRVYRLTLSELAAFSSKPDTTDETFLDRFGHKRMKFYHWSFWPGGNDNHVYKHEAYMFHANCVYGVEQKMNLLKQCGGWYL